MLQLQPKNFYLNYLVSDVFHEHSEIYHLLNYSNFVVFFKILKVGLIFGSLVFFAIEFT